MDQQTSSLPPLIDAETAAEPNWRPRFSANVIGGLLMIFDSLSLGLAAVLAELLVMVGWGNESIGKTLPSVTLVVIVNFFLIRIARGSYGAPLGRHQDLDMGVIFPFGVAVLLTVLTAFILKDNVNPPFRFAFVFAVTGTLALAAGRPVFRRMIVALIDRNVICQRIVVYGFDADVAERAIALLKLERLPYLSLVGLADERRTRVPIDEIRGVPFLGGINEIIQLARDGGVDQVVIALPRLTQDRLDYLLEALGRVAVDVSIMPREKLRLSANYSIHHTGSLALLSLWRRPIRDWHAILKKAEDLVLASVGLALLLPLLIVVAILIRIESPGPIFFRQRRFGFNNEVIEVLKFRSMYVDRQDRSGARRTTRDDPRITRVGRVIRKLSIDELPQLMNVLRGEMSIVGPRPHAVEMRVHDDYYHHAVRGYPARHRVKPGITGLAQVRGYRGEIDTMDRAQKRVEFDLYYINNWSFALDIRIILETIWGIVRGMDAY